MEDPKLPQLQLSSLQIQKDYLRTLLEKNPEAKLSTQVILELLRIQEMPDDQAKTTELHKFNKRIYDILSTPVSQIIPTQQAKRNQALAIAEKASENIVPFSFEKSTLSGEAKKTYDLIQAAYPSFFGEIDSLFEVIESQKFVKQKTDTDRDYDHNFRLQQELNKKEQPKIEFPQNPTPAQIELFKHIHNQKKYDINNAFIGKTFNNVTIRISIIDIQDKQMQQNLNIGFKFPGGEPVINFL